MRMAIPHELVTELQAAGYYPQLAGTMIVESLFGETIESHFVHIDTHVDLDSIHRHVTAFAITPTRLLIAHVDDDPAPRPLGQPPRAMTSSEAVELSEISTGRGSRRSPPCSAPARTCPCAVTRALHWTT